MQDITPIGRFAKPIKFFLIFVLFGILFIYTLPWIFNNSSSREYSGIDFHGYWYAGHYTREGLNPYWAILSRNSFPVYWDPRYPGSGVTFYEGRNDGGLEAELILPIRYLDGHVVEEYPVAQVLIVAPSATAPLTLFMGLFSWFSWLTARTLWLGLNIVLAALIPWLGFRLLDEHRKISLTDKFILALVFYNFYGLRQCLVVGQQSVISLFFLVMALLLARDHWLLAGILLGFGISKYSVGLPCFLLFLLQKEIRIIIVSLIVQALGVLLLTPLAHGSLFETAKAYIKVFDLSYSQDGIHLLARFPENPFIMYLFALVILMVLAYFLRIMYFRPATNVKKNNAQHLNILSLLTIGIFLTIYHRIHDLPFAIFFFLPLLVISVDSLQSYSWEDVIISSAKWLVIALLVFPTLPGKLLSYFDVPPETVLIFASENAISTITMLLMFFVSVWMQLKIFGRSGQVDVSIMKLA